jgi:hypothetical protein
MTELQLFKWVKEWEPEYRWDTNDETKQADVILWFSVYAIESFYKLLDPSLFNDGGGLDARLVSNSIAIWMGEICDYFGIEIENVFPKIN